MKKLILLSLSLFLAVSVFAQTEYPKEIRKASRALGSYNLDPAGNLDKLKEAKSIMEDVTSSDYQMTGAEYIIKGDIYNALATKDAQASLLNPDAKPEHSGAAYEAYSAYKAALGTVEKSAQKRGPLNSMSQLAGLISNEGLFAYEAGEYQSAYDHFVAVLDIHETLLKEKIKSPLDDPGELENQKFILGVAANASGKKDEAKKIFRELIDGGSKNVQVYEQLVNIYLSNEELENAEKLLASGREKFPDEVGLLFAEINYYLKQNRIEELESKLLLAIEKEPGNLSLYTTLGSTYDHLFQKYAADGDMDKAEDAFNKAKQQYSYVISKDPNYTDAIYSSGAIHFNKAAIYVTEMNKLVDDYSKEGTKKYDAFKDKAFEQFDLALDYFKRVEKSNPNDVNTLIALKEIYARKNQLDLAQEFTRRLNNIQSGNLNTSSYFQ